MHLRLTFLVPFHLQSISPQTQQITLNFHRCLLCFHLVLQPQFIQVSLSPLGFLSTSSIQNPSHSLVPLGFYVALQPQFIQGLAEQLSIAVADEANTDTTTPPVSGQSGSVHYTLSNFIYDIDLSSPVVSVSGGNGSPATLTMEWQSFDFVFQMNYDVSVSPLSEKGYVQVPLTLPSQFLSFFFSCPFTSHWLSPRYTRPLCLPLP